MIAFPSVGLLILIVLFRTSKILENILNAGYLR